MSVTDNLPSAILIIGVLYIAFAFPFGWRGLIPLAGIGIFGILMWRYIDTKSANKLLTAQVELLRAKADYYKEKSKCHSCHPLAHLKE